MELFHYIGWDQHGTFMWRQNWKHWKDIAQKIQLFPQDIIWQAKMVSLYNGTKRVDWLWCCKDNETSIPAIKEALEAAVHRQLMSDVPYGVLLSGGLDSSVTSAIAKNMLKTYWVRRCCWCLVSTIALFSVGLEGSPDLAAQIGRSYWNYPPRN
jgi:asparagine synthase (glutamine-hydrolysing)